MGLVEGRWGVHDIITGQCGGKGIMKVRGAYGGPRSSTFARSLYYMQFIFGTKSMILIVLVMDNKRLVSYCVRSWGFGMARLNPSRNRTIRPE
jgi:hypothetical protein